MMITIETTWEVKEKIDCSMIVKVFLRNMPKEEYRIVYMLKQALKNLLSFSDDI